MESQPILQFKSHIKGVNADVWIYPDRIEWSQKGRMTATRMVGAGMTLGAMNARKKNAGTEIIPLKSVSSVTTKKDGIAFTLVSVITSGNTIDFRVSHDRAQEIRDAITALLLGNHPAQQQQLAGVVPPAPVLAQPANPAGWHPDPYGRFAQRYWDGVQWTSNVAGVDGSQSVDPV